MSDNPATNCKNGPENAIDESRIARTGDAAGIGKDRGSGKLNLCCQLPGYVKEFYDPTTGAHYVETPRGLELFSANNPSAWQPIQTAPKDGTPFWAWLHQTGIRKLKFYADDPEWDSGFAECHNPREWWEPEFWLPLEAIPEPPQ